MPRGRAGQVSFVILVLLLAAAEAMVSNLAGLEAGRTLRLLFYVGVATHALLVLLAVWAGTLLQARGFQSAGRAFAAFALVPLLRISSLLLMTRGSGLRQTVLLVLAAAPLAVGIVLLARTQRLRAPDLGLRWPTGVGSALHLLAIPAGAGVGFLGAMVLGLDLPRDPDLASLALVGLAALLAVGLVEEVLFRGLMQGHAMKAFHPVLAVAGIALAYTALHLGQGPPVYLALVFAEAVAFGTIAAMTGSVLGPVLGRTASTTILLLALHGG